MTEYSAVAQRLLRAANSASSQRTEEENAFESLVCATRRNFRRSDSTSPSPRGRKKKSTFTRKVFLTKLAHIDFVPGGTEQRYLKNRGLGEAKDLLVINRCSTIDVIKEDILVLYPIHIQSLLRMSGYRLAKCDRSKKINLFENINNAETLEKELGASKIIVVPNNDFPNDLPPVNENHNLAEFDYTSTTSSMPNLPSSNLESLPSSSISRRSRLRLNIRQERSEDFHMENSLGSPVSIPSQELNEEVLDNFDFEEAIINETETNSSPILILPTLKAEAETLSIEVTRSNCVHEMFRIYSDQLTVDKKLIVTFRDELGVDGGGLTKELFNIFFKEIETKYFRGEDCLIPFLELNKIKEDNFIIIGRILEHMLLLTGTIPSKFSKVVLMLLVDPEKEIEETVLLDELFAYVNPCLRFILKKAINDLNSLKEKEMSILQDFFQSYKFFELPMHSKFKEQLSLIATEILIEAPRRLTETLKKGISLDKYDFWRKCDFGTLLDLQKPTSTKVANCIVTEDVLTNEDSRVLHYLDMYIRCLSSENVRFFVFMITGSFTMPYSINVKFNEFVGLSQRPTFSTCTDTLFLPRTYPSYQDLKNDLNACLQSEEAQIYSMQ